LQKIKTDTTLKGKRCTNTNVLKLQTVLWKEDDTFVIREVISGVTTQGKTVEEAEKNIKEAVSLYIEENPEVKELLTNINKLDSLTVEIP
jgi:predicted RNase H-like HicB family nuclease